MSIEDKLEVIAWLSAVHFCITSFAFYLLGSLSNANADKTYKIMQLQWFQDLNEIEIKTLKVRLDTQNVLKQARDLIKSVPTRKS